MLLALHLLQSRSWAPPLRIIQKVVDVLVVVDIFLMSIGDLFALFGFTIVDLLGERGLFDHWSPWSSASTISLDNGEGLSLTDMGQFSNHSFIFWL